MFGVLQEKHPTSGTALAHSLNGSTAPAPDGDGRFPCISSFVHNACLAYRDHRS